MFRHFDEATAEDWKPIGEKFDVFQQGLVGQLVAHLRLLATHDLGYPVDRYVHSLQTATLALRDGADDEMVVCALLHDIGDMLGTFNHPEVAAAILRPFVSDANHWMVQQHGIFQGYYFFHHIGLDRNLRDMFKGHPYYDRTAEFVELYDNRAFDPYLETFPLSEFEPLVRQLFSQPKQSVYKEAIEHKAEMVL